MTFKYHFYAFKHLYTKQALEEQLLVCHIVRILFHGTKEAQIESLIKWFYCLMMDMI